MEARNVQRTPIRRAVVFHATGNNLHSGKLRDVSPAGMYIETNSDTKLRRNAVIRIGFMVERHLQIARAKVVRQGEDGFGVRLIEDQPELTDAMYQLLANPAPAVAPEPRLVANS